MHTLWYVWHKFCWHVYACLWHACARPCHLYIWHAHSRTHTTITRIWHPKFHAKHAKSVCIWKATLRVPWLSISTSLSTSTTFSPCIGVQVQVHTMVVKSESESDMGRMYSVLRYSCTRVQKFRYSYFTHTHVFSRSGTCTHTHDQMYSYFSRVSNEYTTLYFSLYYQFFQIKVYSYLY